MCACFESHTPLVNGCVDDVLFSAAANVWQTLSQFVNISDLVFPIVITFTIVFLEYFYSIYSIL